MPGSAARWAAALALCGVVGWPAVGWARDDWQVWHEVSAPVWTRGRYELGVLQQTRYQDDMSQPYFVQQKITNTIRLHPRFTAGLHYSYLLHQGAGNHWRDEHRPEVECLPSLPVGPVTLEHRSRLELRLLEGGAGEEDGRYRMRWQATYTLPGRASRVSLFANEELFYSFPPNAWDQHWVFVGLRAKPTKSFSASVAWGIQSLRRGRDWEDRQILSLAARFSF